MNVAGDLFNTNEFKKLLACLEKKCNVSSNNEVRGMGKILKDMQKNPMKANTDKLIKLMMVIKKHMKTTGDPKVLNCQIKSCANELLKYQIISAKMTMKTIKKYENQFKHVKRQLNNK